MKRLMAGVVLTALLSGGSASAADPTATVMGGLPSGTVVFLAKEPPSPIPARWGTWTPCPAGYYVATTMFGAGQTAAPKAGVDVTLTGTTDGWTIHGTNYTVGGATNGVPSVPGQDHGHNLHVTLHASEIQPPTWALACIVKQ
jgi:hypothetical protein